MLAEALARLQATDGDTGLYDTTLAAFRSEKRWYAPDRINIVVLLTDGINDDPTGGIDRAELLRRLKAEQDKGQARPAPSLSPTEPMLMPTLR